MQRNVFERLNAPERSFATHRSRNSQHAHNKSIESIIKEAYFAETKQNIIPAPAKYQHITLQNIKNYNHTLFDEEIDRIRQFKQQREQEVHFKCFTPSR